MYALYNKKPLIPIDTLQCWFAYKLINLKVKLTNHA